MERMEINSRSESNQNGDKRSAENAEKENNTIAFEMENQELLEVDEKLVEETHEVHDMPKDKGWAWLVMLGSVLEMTLVIGMLKSAGIIFVALQERFNSTSSVTSLLSTVQNAVFSMTAPFVLSIGKRVTSSRILLFIGSSIVCTAFLITSQARDIRILFFSHGVMQGFGTAFMQPVAIVTLASWFDKKRGFANSIAVSGGSLGGLILAPLLTFMLEHYGFSGCFMIISSILLHGFVTGSLYRPSSFYKRVKRKTVDKEEDRVEQKPLLRENVNVTNVVNGKLPEAVLEKRSVHGVNETEHVDKDLESETATNGDTIVNANLQRIQQNSGRKKTVSESSFIRQISSTVTSVHSINNSMEYMCGSMLDVRTDSSRDKNQKKEKNDKSTSGISLKSLFKLVISSFDFTLFRNPLFCILQMASFLICANSSLLSVYIAPHARDNGIEVGQIALIVTVFSSTDFVSRIIVAVISDRGWIRRSNITAISVFIVGISGNFIRYFNSFEVLMFYGVILGLFSGVYFSLVSVLIVDYLTIHKLQAAFGFTALFHGAGVSLFFYVLGYLRDVTGSYIVPFHVMGCACLVGSALHFSLPFVERYYKRKQDKQSNGQ